MKLISYRVNTKKGSRGRPPRINLEKLLFLSFIAVFVLLIIVQSALMSPSVRTFLTADSIIEGDALGVEESLYQEGKIVLELLSGSENTDLRILINGDIAAVFTEKKVSLDVKQGDIVEIDGSMLEDAAEVGVFAKSDNIDPACLGKKVTVVSDIKKLAKVKILE